MSTLDCSIRKISYKAFREQSVRVIFAKVNEEQSVQESLNGEDLISSAIFITAPFFYGSH